MILGNFRLLGLAVLLVGSATPSFAAEPAERAVVAPRSALPDGSRNAQASHSRRVELPFLLDFRTPDREPAVPTARDKTAPHPFRESLLKRASSDEQSSEARNAQPRVA